MKSNGKRMPQSITCSIAECHSADEGEVLPVAGAMPPVLRDVQVRRSAPLAAFDVQESAISSQLYAIICKKQLSRFTSDLLFPSPVAPPNPGARRYCPMQRQHPHMPERWDYELWSLNNQHSFCLNTAIDSARPTLEVPDQLYEFVRLLMSDEIIVKIWEMCERRCASTP